MCTRYALRLVLLATLAASGPALTRDAPPDLPGVFVVGAGPAGFGASALNMVNPEPGAAEVQRLTVVR